MNVVFGRPPIWDEAIKVFPLPPGRAVYFAWGNTIYVTGSLKAPGPAIMAHERVHSAQQGNGPELWWVEYLHNPKFRLEQEIPAHAAELAHNLGRGGRAERRAAIAIISAKLAAPLYGNLISKEDAKREILARVDHYLNQPQAM